MKLTKLFRIDEAKKASIDPKKEVNEYKKSVEKSGLKCKVENKVTRIGIEFSGASAYFNIDIDGFIDNFEVEYPSIWDEFTKIEAEDAEKYGYKEAEYNQAVSALLAIKAIMISHWTTNNRVGNGWTLKEEQLGKWKRFVYKHDIPAYVKNSVPKGSQKAQQFFNDVEGKYRDYNMVDVGTIFVSEWGYTMHIVDFYIVTKRTASSVTVAPLMSISVSGDAQEGKIVPSKQLAKPDQVRKIITARLQPDSGSCVKDGAMIKMDDHYAHIWKPNEARWFTLLD